MRGTIAVALVGAFTLTAAQSGSTGPLPTDTLQDAGQATPISSNGLAPIPSGPEPSASNSVVEPEYAFPGAPSGIPSGAMVPITQIASASGGGATPVVIGPNGPEPVPETTEPAPEATEPAPETTEPAPETTEPVPETTEPVPETTEPVPETTEPVPETTEPVPETTEPVPETTELNGQLIEPVPSLTSSSAPVATPAPVASEKVPSGVTGGFPAIMTGEVLGREGYYNSGAGTVKVTATFALAAGIIVALWM